MVSECNVTSNGAPTRAPVPAAVVVSAPERTDAPAPKPRVRSIADGVTGVVVDEVGAIVVLDVELVELVELVVDEVVELVVELVVEDEVEVVVEDDVVLVVELVDELVGGGVTCTSKAPMSEVVPLMRS